MSGILVYALHYDGRLQQELARRRLRGRPPRLRAGHASATRSWSATRPASPTTCARSLGAYGATKVFRVEGPEGLAQPVVDAMAKVISDNGHGYALFGGGLLGFEIGAGLTARLDAGVCMEVTNVRVEDGKLVAERPILGDSQVSDVHYNAGVGVIIGRLNAFEATESGGGAAAVEDVAGRVRAALA